MNVLYLDIDSLRPDHLGSYGYHRRTSPNIDRIAQRGSRFENCYASDVPCLPSRTALFSGMFGIHNGAINHGGAAATPFNEGRGRWFRSRLAENCWMNALGKLGYRRATISSFAERHSAFHFYAGFNDICNTGKNGAETADEVLPEALGWLDRHGRADKWFLHVNLWDPHTAYRTPASFGNPFKDDPLPAWYTEQVRQQHWNGCGPHSAREVASYGTTEEEWKVAERWPRQPVTIDSMEKARMVFDGYDCGVLYADEHIGRLLNKLADLNVLDDTAVLISADHGENLGEFNIYGDHQTADQFTCHIPLIASLPGIGKPGRVEQGLIYNLDFAATLVELLGGEVPPTWDGRSFAAAFRGGQTLGRDDLVLSQGAWSCQRSVRFDRWIYIRSYHDGYHAFPDEMLFDLASDPHEQHDVAAQNPQVVADARARLQRWHDAMMRSAHTPIDPMKTVLEEGGPFHCREQLPAYLKRLRETGRGRWADLLESKHPNA
jgi:arylsulfatase A-like enzyme